jgi:hypothetical protein
MIERPDTPFPRHWLYYVELKYAPLAGRGGRRALCRLPVLVTPSRRK